MQSMHQLTRPSDQHRYREEEEEIAQNQQTNNPNAANPTINQSINHHKNQKEEHTHPKHDNQIKRSYQRSSS